MSIAIEGDSPVYSEIKVNGNGMERAFCYKYLGLIM